MNALTEIAADQDWAAYVKDVAEAEELAGKLRHALDRAKSHGAMAVSPGPDGGWMYIEDLERALDALGNLARPERVDVEGLT